ncbi:unnamed protein product [Macrosiphum euphorbiae]|uniref:GST C-terminal domain-containing protein n=1 Tax=Macrosiphum euphorbiae TaxID=13131 RepID=A0AAV0XPL9_9HEMI|nr:unnamed protein product [Macrosiphum euphorbiae]
MVYLVETYRKEDDPLFPKDTQKRALINQRLLFDLGTLYPAFIDQYDFLFTFGHAKRTNYKEKKLHKALGVLETFLTSSDWVAGDSMTLADISLVASISAFEVSRVDLNMYEKVSKCLKMCKTTMVGYEEINEVGAERLKEFVDKRFAETDS